MVGLVCMMSYMAMLRDCVKLLSGSHQQQVDLTSMRTFLTKLLPIVIIDLMSKLSRN